mmetsp:Transcript_44889/g.80855  ORF Transcript_44889/g.80855 Transcript_44889/m.80855 type:complete len:240 (+) Transcript_44889:399-1118(+)
MEEGLGNLQEVLTAIKYELFDLREWERDYHDMLARGRKLIYRTGDDLAPDRCTDFHTRKLLHLTTQALSDVLVKTLCIQTHILRILEVHFNISKRSIFRSVCHHEHDLMLLKTALRVPADELRLPVALRCSEAVTLRPGHLRLGISLCGTWSIGVEGACALLGAALEAPSQGLPAFLLVHLSDHDFSAKSEKASSQARSEVLLSKRVGDYAKAELRHRLLLLLARGTGRWSVLVCMLMG